MTDRELLEAIRGIVREEAAGIMRQELQPIRESLEEVRDSTNYMAEWVERLENSFKAHEINTAG